MKFLTVSDIHGSLSGASHIMELYAFHQCDAILCCGDILYHGPRNNLPEDYAPKDVIAILNPIADHIIAVRGNCDAEVDQMVLSFAITADYSIVYAGKRKVFMSHGHIYGPEHLPVLQPGEAFLSGHTHIPAAEEKNGIYILNPGSIALPKGGHPRTYGVLEEHLFTVYAMDRTPYTSIPME
ncbi:MAG: phosphodiesterase [Erysipelotrichia bacterium]|nr:phosphodiesterase [Erysipelotrichia bacterium]